MSRYIEENYRGKVVEIGVGGYTGVAEVLDANGEIELVVVDKEDIDDDALNEFVVDDVESPSMDLYRGAELIYSIRPPVEIVGSIRHIAESVDSDLLVVPLHGDDIPGHYRLVNRDGDTLYILRES